MASITAGAPTGIISVPRSARRTFAWRRNACQSSTYRLVRNRRAAAMTREVSAPVEVRTATTAVAARARSIRPMAASQPSAAQIAASIRPLTVAPSRVTRRTRGAARRWVALIRSVISRYQLVRKGHGGGADFGGGAAVGGVVPQQVAQVVVRDVLVVGAVLDTRRGDRGRALGHHGEREQRQQQQRVQHRQDPGSGDELGEYGEESLGVADEVLGRLDALAGDPEPVGEAGLVVPLQLHLRGSGQDLEVRLCGDLGCEAGGGVYGEGVGPRPGPRWRRRPRSASW
ncbi:hypothetical protein ACQUSR_00370 [Streptomyces sp. P1-3]|uniref:hypothetical protein n=1 Tax=Streptomyces sp. P1-3 TaxID=3421658 RepID=UPI003D36EEB4